jgi:two-component system invasion response regulator UvrY
LVKVDWVGAMLHILIADDHALVREGLKQILFESDVPSVVGEASDGVEALEKGLTENWDVIILDISMPLENGLSVLRKLLARRPDLRVIMLSMHSSSVYVNSAMRAGASGYLAKETAPDELLDAISQVLMGRTYLSHSLRDQPNRGDLPPKPDTGP